MIRNVTGQEQKLGYNLDTDKNTEKKAEESFSRESQQEKKPESDFKKYLRVKENLWREVESDPLVKPMYEMIEKEM